jgi:hypothetical protein
MLRSLSSRNQRQQIIKFMNKMYFSMVFNSAKSILEANALQLNLLIFNKLQRSVTDVTHLYTFLRGGV